MAAAASGHDASPVGQGLASQGASFRMGALPSFMGSANQPLLSIRTFQVLRVFAVSCRMTSRSMLIESLATAILDSKGIEAIWQLHLDAAYAYRTDYPIAAEAILELAEAAERVLMRRERAPISSEP